MVKKRVLSLLGAAAVTAVLALALNAFYPADRFSVGSIQDGLCYEATGVSPDAIVASVAGNGASADLVTYWVGYNASYLDSYMQYYTGAALDWEYTLTDGQSVRDYVSADVLDTVKQQLVIENLAEKYGVTLSDEQSLAMEQNDAAYIAEYGSEEAYEEEIAKLGLTRATYDRIMRSNYLYQNLYTLYMTEGSSLYAPEKELSAYAAEQGYISADHILLATIDLSTGEALSEAELSVKLALAEELSEKLKAYEGDDLTAYFASLADEYSEDTGRAAYPAGYTFTEGEMLEAFETTAYALSEGAVSEIVESPVGYHIILRLPLDEAAAAETVRGAYFDSFINDSIDAQTVKTSSDYDKLDPQVLYEAIQNAQTQTK